MRLVTCTHVGSAVPVPGVLMGDGKVLPLPQALEIAMRTTGTTPAGPVSMRDFETVLAIIGLGERGLAAVEWLVGLATSGELSGVLKDMDEVTLLAPIPRPAKNIFCVGRNYVDHITEGYRARDMEVKLPEFVQLFSKPPTTVTGPDQPIRYDQRITQKLDYEVELAVVIGKTGRDISEDDALDHVFGYTIVNDITARDLQRRHDQWFKGKGLDTSCPMGPWIVTRDEIPFPENLRISLSVNGETRQSASTSQMIFKLPKIIAELSKGLTLEAGDIIATGTPSGVGYAMDPPRLLEPGDIVTCEIEGLGKLTNVIVAV
ncbi:fumarylacetoacetate hydrolase family protein [Caballeronia sp. KNU42]